MGIPSYHKYKKPGNHETKGKLDNPAYVPDPGMPYYTGIGFKIKGKGNADKRVHQ
jgi:hypothetical protein